MSPNVRLLGAVLIGVAMLGCVDGTTSVAAQSVATGETARSVARMLEHLPYYGVFDFIAFGVNRGTVTLVGYAYQGNLKRDAEMAAKRSSGVDEVADKIEILPASINDDRIRWATYYAIYADSSLSRYVRGGEGEVHRELRDERHFPGMQPVGIYPIHIIVKNGHTMLLGVVDNAADRQIAEVRARGVIGVFDVENDLTVAR
jgi:hyperosmotically inducible protein